MYSCVYDAGSAPGTWFRHAPLGEVGSMVYVNLFLHTFSTYLVGLSPTFYVIGYRSSYDGPVLNDLYQATFNIFIRVTDFGSPFTHPRLTFVVQDSIPEGLVQAPR